MAATARLMAWPASRARASPSSGCVRCPYTYSYTKGFVLTSLNPEPPLAHQCSILDAHSQMVRSCLSSMLATNPVEIGNGVLQAQHLARYQLGIPLEEELTWRT